MMEVLREDRIMPTLYDSPSAQDKSETVDLYSALGDALLGEELGNLHTLITLELDDLTSLFILDESAVASKFLRKQQSAAVTRSVTQAGAYTFLNAFRSFFASYSRRRT